MRVAILRVRLCALLLVAAMSVALLAGAVPASAASPAGGGQSFTDLAGFGWASAAIDGADLLGVMQGTGEGQFEPAATTTRAQVAVVLARLFGWPSGAQTPSFTDWSSVPSWAQGAVAAAAQRDILQGEPDGSFQPNAPVTWAELAVIAARAFSLSRVPSGQTSAYLSSLPQGAATPSWAAEASAQDVEAGAFPGILALLYQPSQAVSRAGLATFLMNLAGQAGNPGVVTGQVTAVTAGGLSLRTASGVQTLPLTDATSIYDGSSPSALSSVQPGESVSVILVDGQAAWLDVTSSPARSVLHGTIVALASNQVEVGMAGGMDLTVPVAPAAAVTQGGQASSLAAADVGSSVTVTLDGGGTAIRIVLGGSAGASSSGATPPAGSGSTSAVSGTSSSSVAVPAVMRFSFSPSPIAATGALTPGSSTTVQLTAFGSNGQPVAGATVYLSFIQASGGGSAQVAGTNLSATAQAFTTGSGGQLSISYLAPAATPTGGSDTISAANAASGPSVVASDSYTFAPGAGVVAPNETVTGTLESVAAGQSLTLALNGGQVATVPLAPYASATLNGIGTTPASLPTGDTVTVTLNASAQASTIVAYSSGSSIGTVAPGSTVTGTLEAVDGTASLTLQVTGGQVATLYFAPYATVTLNGVESSALSLAPGDAATVTVNPSTQVTAVVATTGGSAGLGTQITGTVQAVNGSQSLTLAVTGGQVETLSFAPYVTVTLNGQVASTGSLIPGSTVTLTLNTSGQVSLVTAYTGGSGTATVAPDTTVTGTVEAVDGGVELTIEETNGQIATMSFAPYVTVTLNGQTSSTAAIVVGEQATATIDSSDQVSYVSLSSYTGTTGTVTPNSTLTGTVESVDGSYSLTVAETGGQVLTLPFAPYVTVTLNGVSTTESVLEPGDTVTLTVNDVSQVSLVTAYGSGGANGVLEPNSSLTGTIESVNGGYSLTLLVGGSDAQTLVFAPGVTATLNGQLSSVGALTAGETVTVELNNVGQVAVVTAYGAGAPSGTVAPDSTVGGTVEAVDGTQSLTVELTGGSTVTLPLASGLTVLINGASTGLGQVAVGDTATLTLNALTQISSIDVTSSALGNNGGTVSTGVLVSDQSSQGSISIYGSSGLSTYTLATGATVTLNGASSSLSSLEVGDNVSISLVNGLLAGLAATSPTSAQQIVSGTLASPVVGGSTTLLVTVGGTTETLDVGSYAVGVENDSLIVLSSLAQGSQVTVVPGVAPYGSALVIAG